VDADELFVILLKLFNSRSPVRKKPVFDRKANVLRIFAYWKPDPYAIRGLVQELTTKDVPRDESRLLANVKPPDALVGNVNFTLHLPLLGADSEPRVVNGKFFLLSVAFGIFDKYAADSRSFSIVFLLLH